MTETTPPIVGIEAVLETFRKFSAGAESVEFKVLETFNAGPIVMNRRTDRFVSQQPLTWEGVGVFFVKDGKIKEWSDYTMRGERPPAAARAGGPLHLFEYPLLPHS